MEFRTNAALSLGLLALTAGTVLAGGTLTDGDASFTMLGNPVFSTNLPESNLLTDLGGIDNLAKFTWYYRTPANGQNSYFSKLDNPSESYSGNTASIQYTNAGPGVAGQERFNATFRIQLLDGANPGQATVKTTLVFQNNSQGRNTFQVFNLLDLDLGGIASAGDDTLKYNAGESRIRFTDKNTAAYGDFVGVNATRFEMADQFALRNKLDGGLNNLSNDLNDYTGNGAGAFQWTLDLAAGESATIESYFTIAIPTPGSLAVLGLGGLVAGRRRR